MTFATKRILKLPIWHIEKLTYRFLQKAHILICNTLNVLSRQLFLVNTWDFKLVIFLQQGKSSASIPHLYIVTQTNNQEITFFDLKKCQLF